MNGKLMLYVDQYGHRPIWARSANELLRKVREGGERGRLFKIYQDKRDGTSVHIGYGVGKRWFNAFIPYEAAA